MHGKIIKICIACKSLPGVTNKLAFTEGHSGDKGWGEKRQREVVCHLCSCLYVHYFHRLSGDKCSSSIAAPPPHYANIILSYHVPGLCSTHESWVKFDSTLTQMSRVRVESALKIRDMSRVRVESCRSSFESEMIQLNTAWVNVESLIFLKRKR